MTRAETIGRIAAAWLALFLTATPAMAVAEEATPDTRIHFDIPRQPADLALTQFADQANLTLLFPTDGVEQRTANALAGEYTLDEAIDILLAGTGLRPTFKNRLVLDIAIDDESTVEGEAMNINKKAGLIAILAGALAGSANAQDTNTPREATVPASEVRGKVTDFRTGANLKGALVEIEETGQTTSTGDLGEFRFPAVAEGEYTLRVSYLGYAGQSADIVADDGQAVVESFKLSGAGVLEEITVYGTRSARALALNLERTAENSTTVLSSDLLGQFSGTTLAESLRRAPGVAFQESALTGEGTNIIIRGMGPDFNQIRLNGQRLAEGSGRGRSPAIGNLLTESIDEVKISKTLLPSQDSSGAGGLVEITTKGPFDRPGRYADFYAEGTVFDNDFRDSMQLSGTVSGLFGDNETFGLSASVQYRETSNQTVGYLGLETFGSSFGQYLPLADDGSVITSINSISPLTPFPFESGVDDVYPSTYTSRLTKVDIETLAGTFEAEWHPLEHTELRLSYTRSDQETAFVRRSSDFSPLQRYVPLPIPELDGEVRGALLWEDAFAEGGFPGNLVQMRQSINPDDVEDSTDVLSFQGQTNLGAWGLDYRLSSSDGERTSADRQWNFRNMSNAGFAGFVDVSPDWLLPQVFENLIDGKAVSLFEPVSPGDKSLQLPLFNQAGFDYFNDPAHYVILPSDGIRERTVLGENRRRSAAFSLRRNFSDSVANYLEAGVEYEASRFDFFITDEDVYAPACGCPLSLADLGLTSFRGDNLTAIGLNGGFFTPTVEDLSTLFARLDALSSGETPLFTKQILSSDNFGDEGTFTDEEELAVWLQGRIDIGDFELIGGFRWTDVDVFVRRLVPNATLVLEDGTLDREFQERSRELVDEEATQSKLLPRIAVNYRPRDNLVVRGGYFQSVARPNVRDLSSNQTVSLDLQPNYGPGGDQPQLQINKGNPALRPAVTHSFDLSAALYDVNAGVLQLSLFYKTIEDYLEFTGTGTVTGTVDSSSLEGVTLPADPRFQNLPDNIFITNRQPTNNDRSAKIYGFELAVERQFVGLPGIWSGLGVFANYTYSDSEKFFLFANVFDPVTGDFADVEVPGIPFDGSPKHSGTVALTYSQYGIDASIVYTKQSERLLAVFGNNLYRYADADDALDARVEYRFDGFGGVWRVFVSGRDLLKGTDDPDTLEYTGGVGTTGKYYGSGTYFGGRTFTVGVSSVF